MAFSWFSWVTFNYWTWFLPYKQSWESNTMSTVLPWEDKPAPAVKSLPQSWPSAVRIHSMVCHRSRTGFREYTVTCQWYFLSNPLDKMEPEIRMWILDFCRARGKKEPNWAWEQTLRLLGKHMTKLVFSLNSLLNIMKYVNWNTYTYSISSSISSSLLLCSTPLLKHL